MGSSLLEERLAFEFVAEGILLLPLSERFD
jgi:hypothetical protein